MDIIWTQVSTSVSSPIEVGIPRTSRNIQSRELALDAGREDRFLAFEVVVEPARSRSEPGNCLDLGDAGGGVAALAEEAHCFVEDPLAGCA